jgi:hypothetical protein
LSTSDFSSGRVSVVWAAVLRPSIVMQDENIFFVIFCECCSSFYNTSEYLALITMVPPWESQNIIAIIFLVDGCVLKFLAYSDICFLVHNNVSKSQHQWWCN